MHELLLHVQKQPALGYCLAYSAPHHDSCADQDLSQLVPSCSCWKGSIIVDILLLWMLLLGRQNGEMLFNIAPHLNGSDQM